MISAALPGNEEQRLQSLNSYEILDTESEIDFDHLIELAALICQCDISIINFIDPARAWSKAKRGIDEATAPREISMCAHTILQNDVMEVEDASLDVRFFDNPSVVEAGVRFYAGAPICSDDGYNIGTLCVCDSKPRKLRKDQVEALKRLSRQAAILVELRKKNKKLQVLAQHEQILKEEAQAARKGQEQFLSTMSHEIRTPLNGIIGMVNLLLLESPNQEQLENLNTLKFSSENLLCIVNDILDYNKIAAGKIDLEEIDFNLHRLITNIKKTHLPKAAEKAISINIAISQDVPEWIKGDPTRITQVLHNLVGNAIKFTSNGGVSIIVKPAGQDQDKDFLLFEIQDTGIGIKADQHELIFDQFSQANEGITRNFGGTGLGLAITRKLVQLMGGEVKLRSVLNEGSCFYFKLPIKQGGKQGTDPHVADMIFKAFRGSKILIVEDNKVNVLVLKKFLQKWEIETDDAGNGLLALEKLDVNNYDLILMDMQMPVMDGLTAIKKIRSDKKLFTPVILITADAMVNLHNEVQAWGFNDFILKPFDPEDLYTKINKYLSVHAIDS